jgi:hypothetical protein
MSWYPAGRLITSATVCVHVVRRRNERLAYVWPPEPVPDEEDARDRGEHHERERDIEGLQSHAGASIGGA